MMNFNKVRNFIANKLKEYRPYYEEDGIFENLETEVYGGSFGRCFVSIRNDYFSLSDRYCGNYNDIEAVISEFFTRCYDRVASRFYYEHKQETKAHPMSATLEILADGECVNVFNFETLEKAKSELIKIFVAKFVGNC